MVDIHFLSHCYTLMQLDFYIVVKNILTLLIELVLMEKQKKSFELQ